MTVEASRDFGVATSRPVNYKCGSLLVMATGDRVPRDASVRTLTVSPDGAELTGLVELAGLAESARLGRRRLVGLAGTPGAGKSLLTTALVRLLGPRGAQVPMDGFHLADAALVRQGLLDMKGAPDTFDVRGYAALLERLRMRPSYTVYAPDFERDLEQPIAGAIAVEPDVDVIFSEGNYLLLDRPEWREVRAQFDEVWYVECTDAPVRLQRLLARHVASGKSEQAAMEWVARVDEPNARLVEATRSRADLLIDLTAWNSAPTG